MYLCMYIYGELYIECSIPSGHLRMYIGWILLLYRGKASLAFLVYLFVGGGQRRVHVHMPEQAHGVWRTTHGSWSSPFTMRALGIKFSSLGLAANAFLYRLSQLTGSLC